jgi:hypothetical protein
LGSTGWPRSPNSQADGAGDGEAECCATETSSGRCAPTHAFCAARAAIMRRLIEDKRCGAFAAKGDWPAG